MVELIVIYYSINVGTFGACLMNHFVYIYTYINYVCTYIS